ncbi:MAG: hypothetical protein ACRC9H_14450 [Aeromonas veronii]
MSDLVGKWVLLDSVFIGGVVGSKPHLVTSVSGKRAYISEATQRLVDGDWVFDGGSEPSGFKLIKTIKYSFESLDDCVAAGEVCRELHWDWWTKSKQNMNNDCVSHIISLGGTLVK